MIFCDSERNTVVKQLSKHVCTLNRPLAYNHKYLFPSNRQKQGLPPVIPQEKAHKQGTSSLPVFKDDSYGMQSHFLLARLISPSQTSGCSSTCSCSMVRANSATAELSNTVLSHSSHLSPLQKKTIYLHLPLQDTLTVCISQGLQ